MNSRAIPSLTSKPTGEHFEFLASSHGPGGLFEFRWTLAPGKRGPGEHYHPRETETFTVLSGALRIWIDGVPKDYSVGETIAIPPMARHRFLNFTKEPAVMHVTLDGPAMEDAFMPMAFAFEGRTNIRARDIARILVHASKSDASIPASPRVAGTMRGLARMLERFGVRGFDPIDSWQPNSTHEAEVV